ncbi:MAG TPA: MotA/TolQ/ExbB proton channel family protein [Candidatus Thiothrix moscowensis]|uniref:MotA/TolQ/ExbB proton channel family protein n=1 Tax=unclassified Thiothrix TaxID=2636184 RepID=UPI0025DB4D5C|nr:MULTISPECIES: MotA/TolQ/ExbB proton channel family protein [unclassified Thiothrix]HRJ53243.1 MotA/TolQ/ExbB proton channel family protein [Candidatus Thiothrix moscowensis]HRJ93187.1 MotA/TolQ/ExbB proton channel family protein [Candidatus Thiothrix moscowensis]
MFELIKSGGIMMFPLILSSVIAVAIIIERFMSLRVGKVVPAEDIERARKLAGSSKLQDAQVDELRNSSLMGRVLATGLESRELPRHIMKENVEEAGRHAVQELERYLPALGTVVTIAPMMGLLGTVLGMIGVFSAINAAGVGNPQQMAGGISEALITTVAGLLIAIITLVFERYFKAKVDGYVATMEREALRLIEIANSNRKTMPAMPAGAAARPAPAVAASTAQQRPAPAAGTPPARGGRPA